MPRRRTPVVPTSTHSRRRGSGTPCRSVTGTITLTATHMRKAANVTGGTSRTPSLMNSHTVLQIAQVRIQTRSVAGVTNHRFYPGGSRGARKPAAHNGSDAGGPRRARLGFVPDRRQPPDAGKMRDATRRRSHSDTRDCSAMKRLLLLVLFVLAGVHAVSTTPQQPRATAAGNHVVVISLDGFAGWAMDDPYLPIPTLRRLAARGVTATKGMVPVNPTVTWANHTSMVTGVTPAKHGVLFNGLLFRDAGVPPRVEPWRDRNEMVKAKTLYDAAHERGMTTAQVDWVAILNAPTITWEFPERPDPGGQVARELVKSGAISQTDLETFHTRNIAWRDHIWTLAAAHILRQHRPNLLMFHLLNLDS